MQVAQSPPVRQGPRREWKLLALPEERAHLLAYARENLERDPFTRSAGDPTYRVESIYLDSKGLSCYHGRGEQKLSKYRLRRYEGRDTTWFFEEKTRIGERVWKRRVSCLPEEVRAMRSAPARGLEWFASRLAELDYRPRLLVTYERMAFLVEEGERLTIDWNLQFHTADDLEFVGPSSGEAQEQTARATDCVVEFKFDRPRPSERMRTLLELMKTPPSSYSKYRLGIERLGMNGEPV